MSCKAKKGINGGILGITTGVTNLTKSTYTVCGNNQCFDFRIPKCQKPILNAFVKRAMNRHTHTDNNAYYLAISIGKTLSFVEVYINFDEIYTNSDEVYINFVRVLSF